jgi:glycosyltransferase involved in cell wall biosynthesis|tara:strand:+ start:866 stop:1612 length:747 start_codon:yes stop_codon:yes gene_type:complete
MNEHFTIIIPTYNCIQWVEKNLESVCTQDYEAYDIVYIDDASPDGTASAVKKYLEINPFTKGEFTLVENPFNKGKMENMYGAVHDAADKTIIVVVDGDDWLAGPEVLQKLNEVYKDGPVWMTNGSYQEVPTNQTVSPRINQTYWNGNIRHKGWEFSHLGTFRKELFCKIKRKDLMNKKLEFWNTTSDQAMMWPMAEMSGPDHFRAIEEVLYIYNRLNPLSDDKVHRADQLATEHAIRTITPYSRLDTL